MHMRSCSDYMKVDILFPPGYTENTGQRLALPWLHMMKAISVSMEVGPRYMRWGRLYCAITFL